MNVSEFLAESKRIEDLRGFLARDEREVGESIARDAVRELLRDRDRMREALEAVLELTRQVDSLSKRHDGVPNEEYQAGGRHAVREVVARIESALAENGEENNA